jgi:VanZ family protein
MSIAARELATIWLPVTLCAVVAALLGLVRPSMARPLVWVAICFGVALLWFLSEPQVSIGSHPRWIRILLALGLGCSLSSLVLFGKWACKRGAVFGWALVLACMSWQIAFFSSPSGGSGGMIAAAIDFLGLSTGQAEVAVLVVRKCIHFCFYGMLGWTAFRFAMSTGAERVRSIVFGVALAISFAMFDEGRQTFFFDRTGSTWDVLLDTAGAVALVWFSARRSPSESGTRVVHSQTMLE